MRLSLPCLTKRHFSLIFLPAIFLIVSLTLIAPGIASSADKSVIVGFHQKPKRSAKDLIRGARGRIKRTYRLINAMSVTIPEEEIVKLKKDKKVAYVEENGVFRTALDPPPEQEYTNAWGVTHIGSDIAHANNKKGSCIKVAVIDTGIDYTHEDLSGNYAGGWDFVFNDSDPYDDNFQSHGTHVAGIIAAEENGIGVIGVAPEVELYALKVLDGGGFGLGDWIIAAIEWAVENQMDIVNLSLEGPDLESLHIACDSAYNAGVLLVAAGGNTNGGNVAYPAAYDSVIAVTVTDTDDLPAYFSPVGPELELAAPGVQVLSTVTSVNGTYNMLNGTSQAAPHVTGTAALLFHSNTEDLNGDQLLNHEDVRLKLQLTAIDLGDAGRDDVYGFGLVDATSAVIPPCSIDEDCNDNNPCTDDVCNTLVSECVYTNNTAPCDDGLFCNGEDTCSDGCCTGHTGSPCPETQCNTCQEETDSCFDPAGTLCADDGNLCTDDECDGTGTCAHPDNTDFCDDTLYCTETDQCSGGACVGSGNPCNASQLCDEETDMCYDDSDGDGIVDSEDNCISTPNPSQEDTYPPQGNGIGDACDCEANFNCNENVGGNDVELFLLDFSRSQINDPCTEQNPCNGDFDCNGAVDADDVTILLEDFGRSIYNDPCPPCQAGNWCVY